MTLRARFTLMIAGAILLTGFVLVGGSLVVERRYLLIEGKRTHQTNTEHLAHLCAESLLTHDELSLVNFVKELSRAPDLREALCVNEEGQVLAHTDLSLLGRRVDALASPWPAPPWEPPNPALWVYTQAAPRNGNPVTLARTTYDAGKVQGAVNAELARMARRSVGLGTVVLAFALLLAWGAAQTLTRPIQRLARVARRVGSGDLSARVGEDGPGELGTLAKEFNAMAGRLGELDRLKDQFINTVSHDLRNPLSAIATSAKMLRSDTHSATSGRLLKVIETATLRLRAMVNNILDTARMREGRLIFEKTVFHSQRLFEDLGELFAPLAAKSGKAFVLEIPSDLPPLFADEEKASRVFLNLLSNAFKFTREGDRISLAATAAGEWVEFRISDTGWGIPADRLPLLFEPYHAVGVMEGAPPRQGTGLGLSIVKTLVEGHGGTVRVESVPGKGATFWVTFPIAKASP